MELIIWRPILAKIVNLDDVKSGRVTLADLQKICALMDMQSDIEYANIKSRERREN